MAITKSKLINNNPIQDNLNHVSVFNSRVAIDLIYGINKFIDLNIFYYRKLAPHSGFAYTHFLKCVVSNSKVKVYAYYTAHII